MFNRASLLVLRAALKLPFPRSAGFALFLTVIIGAGALPVIAQDGAPTAASLGPLIAAITSKGRETELPERAREGFGLGPDAISIRELDQADQPDKRAVAVDEKNDLFLFHISAANAWVLRVAPDGSISEGLHAQAHTGFQHMPETDLVPQVKTEESYWLGWLADLHGIREKGASSAADR